MTCQLPTPEALMMDTWLLEYNKDAVASARLPFGMLGRDQQRRLYRVSSCSTRSRVYACLCDQEPLISAMGCW